MNEIRSAAQAGVANGTLFVLGGKGDRNSPTIEKYDPQEDKWTMVAHISGYSLKQIDFLLIDTHKFFILLDDHSTTNAPGKFRSINVSRVGLFMRRIWS